MMLTVEEYLFLRRMMEEPGQVDPGQTVVEKPRRKPRRKSTYNKALGRELRKLNARYKTKSGAYRKGFDAARIMKMAHKKTKGLMK